MRIIQNLPDADYRSAAGLSNSMLKEFMRSPAHYRAALQQTKEATKALNFGTAFHQHILTPELNLVVVKPDVDGRTAEGKRINAEFAEKSVGKTIIKQEEWEALNAMSQCVNENEIARKLLEITNKEVSVFNTIRGIECKGRMDMLKDDNKIIADLKTCESADPERIKWTIKDYLYDVQNVHYSFLIENPNAEFYFVFVEKTPPYPVTIVSISPETLARSCERYYAALDRFKTCVETETYPSYCEGIQVIAF
jgi:hypothetical protein